MGTLPHMEETYKLRVGTDQRKTWETAAARFSMPLANFIRFACDQMAQANLPTNDRPVGKLEAEANFDRYAKNPPSKEDQAKIFKAIIKAGPQPSPPAAITDQRPAFTSADCMRQRKCLRKGEDCPAGQCLGRP